MERKEGSFQIFKKEVILEPIKGKCAVFSRFQQNLWSYRKGWGGLSLFQIKQTVFRNKESLNFSNQKRFRHFCLLFLLAIADIVYFRRYFYPCTYQIRVPVIRVPFIVDLTQMKVWKDLGSFTLQGLYRATAKCFYWARKTYLKNLLTYVTKIKCGISQ